MRSAACYSAVLSWPSSASGPEVPTCNLGGDLGSGALGLMERHGWTEVQYNQSDILTGNTRNTLVPYLDIYHTVLNAHDGSVSSFPSNAAAY